MTSTSGQIAANKGAPASSKKMVVVGVGNMLTSSDPHTMLVTHSLGSCIGVVAYDPVAHVGGMLHAMLPSSAANHDRAVARPFMFVDTGLPALFTAIYGLGGTKDRLVVTIAGGAQFITRSPMFNIGARNAASVTDLLLSNGITAHLVECGGQYSRTLRLDLASGGLILDAPGCQPRYL